MRRAAGLPPPPLLAADCDRARSARCAALTPPLLPLARRAGGTTTATATRCPASGRPSSSRAAGPPTRRCRRRRCGRRRAASPRAEFPGLVTPACPARLLARRRTQAYEGDVFPGVRPLYYSTASQLGLVATRGIPGLVVRAAAGLRRRAPPRAALRLPAARAPRARPTWPDALAFPDAWTRPLLLVPGRQDFCVPDDSPKAVRDVLSGLLVAPPPHAVAASTRSALRRLRACPRSRSLRCLCGGLRCCYPGNGPPDAAAALPLSNPQRRWTRCCRSSSPRA